MSEVVDDGYDEPALPLSQRAAPKGPKPHWNGTEGIVEGDATTDFFEAFLKAQKQIPAIIEADAENPFQKNRYASLGQTIKAVRKILNDHGFIVTQGCGQVRAYGEGQHKWHALPVHTTLIHAETGQFQTYLTPIPIGQKKTAQDVGSAITYGRRYSLLSALGVATGDDDGQAASQEARIDMDNVSPIIKSIIEKIEACETEKELKDWHEKNKQGFEGFSEDDLAKLRDAYGKQLKSLKGDNGGKNGKA